MSNPKLTWAVCIMAALSLGGCAVDATGTDYLDGEDAARVAQWYLSSGAEAPTGEDDGSTDGVEDEAQPEDDFMAGELLDDEYSTQGEDPVDPHPDPWNPGGSKQSVGTGNQD